MTERSLGENIAWWVGVVVNVMDPNKAGRVQVRVYGRHDDTINIPNAALPWALVMQPVTSAAIGKIGTAPLGLVAGSRVIGLWADSDHQYPIVIGSIGKDGDPISGSLVNGAPAINSSTGSIPGPSQGALTPGQALNPYSIQNPARIPASSIFSGIADIFSVPSTAGISIPHAVNNLIPFATLPTTASLLPSNNASVLNAIKIADPAGAAQIFRCLPNPLLALFAIMALLASISRALISAMAGALVNALLILAKKIGLLTLLGLLNAIALEIAELKALLAALLAGCGPNVLNQGGYNQVNLVMAQAIHSLNTLANYNPNAPSAANALAVAQVQGAILQSIQTAPAASVATPFTAAPPASSIVGLPPATYTVNYNNGVDTFPGYIQFTDPTGVGSPVYVPRNGTPNYTSATQAAQFGMQNAMLPSLLSSFSTPNLSATPANLGATLTNIVTGGVTSAKNIATSSVLGTAAALGTPGAILGLLSVFAAPVAKTVTNTFTPQNTKSTVTSSSATSSMTSFASVQAKLAQQQMQMRAALGN